jgi:hypothetical protein
MRDLLVGIVIGKRGGFDGTELLEQLRREVGLLLLG